MTKFEIQNYNTQRRFKSGLFEELGFAPWILEFEMYL